MIIRKVRMVYFRGYTDKTIEFYSESMDESVVLLSAANGIGKTTTIDAIEWCLTGEIGRLKHDYDSRSNNESERKMNKAGILKNRNAKSKDLVKVFLWLLDGEKEVVLCRTQKSDEIDKSSSTVTIDGDEKKAETFLQEYIGDSFYNFHFCDIHKSFNIQSQRPNDLKTFFEEFITNYDDEKQIAANLDIFADDVKRHVEDKEKQKVSSDIIAVYREQLENARHEATLVPYPKIVFYPEEQTEIDGFDKEALEVQKGNVQNCAYRMAEDDLAKLVSNEALKSQKTLLAEIHKYWETQEKSVCEAIEAELDQREPETITSKEVSLNKLKELSLKKDSILKDATVVIELGNAGFTQEDFDKDSSAIQKKEAEVEELEEEIELLSDNNKLLTLLVEMNNGKNLFLEYRDTMMKEAVSVRCPVCGSETFATIEADQLLQEAAEYIRKNGEAVGAKKTKVSEVKEEIDGLYQSIIDRAVPVVAQEKETLELEIRRLKALKEEMKTYFNKVQELQKTRKALDLKSLNKEKLDELIAEVDKELLEDAEEKRAQETYQQILTVLGYKHEGETLEQTAAKVKNIVKSSGFTSKITNFSYEVLVAKINALQGLLSDQKIKEYEDLLNDANKKNQRLDREIAALQELKEKAENRAKDIRTIVAELSKDEYEKVGPVLGKYYNKLTRLNSGDKIKIVQKNEGIALVDGKDKNIVNVLSNGQISVFMLAYFFASINARHDKEKFKIYFIDDLTACMDDVNMLAFLDLLKYQMSSKSTMEQLFFVTCDQRISELLKYKMNGRGIRPREILEDELIEA